MPAGEILLLGVWFHACSLGATPAKRREALAKSDASHSDQTPLTSMPCPSQRDRDERRASRVTSSAPPSSGQGSQLKRRWADPRSRQRESCVIHTGELASHGPPLGLDQGCISHRGAIIMGSPAVTCREAGVTMMLPTLPGHASSVSHAAAEEGVLSLGRSESRPS